MKNGKILTKGFTKVTNLCGGRLLRKLQMKGKGERGKGDKIKLWDDICILEQPFPRLYANSIDKSGAIVNFGRWRCEVERLV